MSTTLIIPFDIVSQHIMVALNTRRGNSGNDLNNSSKTTTTSRTSAKSLPAASFKSSFFKPLSLNPDDLRRFGLAIAITKQLYREGGFRSFYRGYFASLLCFAPSSACWWMLYNYFNEFLYGTSVKHDMPYMLLNCMSGTMSGAAVSIMTNPLDLLRANIQVHRPSSYRSAVKYLWKEDRWRIFNKGLTARLTQSCISSALIVIGYETLKRFSVDEKYRDQVRW